MKKEEVRQAIERGIKYGLLHSSIDFQKPICLEREEIQAEISMIIESTWGGPFTGLCQVIVFGCIEKIKKRLDCNAWPTFGWVTDISRGDFWKMDADELCRGLANGCIRHAEFHAWITLDSGEVIDPVIYPTLAELFPNRFGQGRGRINMHKPTGYPYKLTPGLPIVQYRPSVFGN